jgi:hypothetical protein
MEKRLTAPCFLGNPSLFAGQTRWMKAEQAKPYAASWVIGNRTSAPSLGPWLLPGPLLGRTWPSYLTKRTKHLILAKQGVYEIYHPNRHRKYPVTPHITVSSLPSDAYPIPLEFSPRSSKVKRSPGLFPVSHSQFFSNFCGLPSHTRVVGSTPLRQSETHRAPLRDLRNYADYPTKPSIALAMGPSKRTIKAALDGY